MDLTEKIRVFRNTFAGRDDIIANFGKNGWRPLRLPNGEQVKFSDKLVYKHLRGHLFLGIYPLLSNSTCKFIAVDFDNHHGDRSPLKDVQLFCETSECQDIQVYVLKSKSGTGYHCYFFFEDYVPACKARTVAHFLLEEAGIKREESSFDKIFPAQDELSGKGFGNLISLPFQGRVARNGFTVFLDPRSNFQNPHKQADQYRILSTVEKYNVSFLDEIIAQYKLSTNKEMNKPDTQGNSNIKLPADQLPRHVVFNEILNECGFVKHCQEDSFTLSYDEWWSLGTIAVNCVDGENLFHGLSVHYPNYNRKETNRLIYSILKSPAGPHTCHHIEKKTSSLYCNSCKYKGKIKSPINLGKSERKNFKKKDFIHRFSEDLISDYFENDHTATDEITHEGVYLFETDIDFSMLEDWTDTYDDKESDDYY